MSSIYVIHIRGTLDPRWSAWFDGLAISYTADGDTLLSGPIADQAALYGVIGKLRDLGATLLAVNRHNVAEAEPVGAPANPLRSDP